MAPSLEELLKLPPAEMAKYNEWPSQDQLRKQVQVYFDDVKVGMELPKYVRKYNITHFQRWSITNENTHRLHYDLAHAVNHDKLPGVLFHGTWRMSILATWLKNWTLPNGWPWKASWEVRAMVVPGETIIVWGKVTNTQVKDGMGIVDLDFGIINEDGIEGCPGKATVALPLRGGKPVPYPFVPPKGL
jgi:acyl dehydratase